MNEFIILLRPYPIVQDSLILNSRTAGMLNNPSDFLTVCLPAIASATVGVRLPVVAKRTSRYRGPACPVEFTCDSGAYSSGVGRNYRTGVANNFKYLCNPVNPVKLIV
jgi:hypothetical protein